MVHATAKTGTEGSLTKGAWGACYCKDRHSRPEGSLTKGACLVLLQRQAQQVRRQRTVRRVGS